MPTLTDRELLWSILLGLACLGLFATLLLTACGILVIAGTRWARNAFERWMTPDPADLCARLAQLQQRHPTLGNAALVLKVVPLVGAVVGFVFNYAAARATGELAARWYRGELRLLGQMHPTAQPLTR